MTVKKIPALFFLMVSLAQAQWYQATINLKDGTVLKDEIKLNLKKGDKQLMTKNQAKISCEHVEAVTIKDDQGNELTLAPLLYFTRKYSWGIPMIRGDVSLYRVLFNDESLKMKFKEGGMVKISSYGTFGYALTKDGYKYKGRETYMLIHYPGAKLFGQFKLAVNEILKDCPQIIKAVKAKQYSIENADEMVVFYNDHCSN